MAGTAPTAEKARQRPKVKEKAEAEAEAKVASNLSRMNAFDVEKRDTGPKTAHTRRIRRAGTSLGQDVPEETRACIATLRRR